MFNLLPLTFVFSILLWASVIYTFVGCAQLIIFEQVTKKANPNVKNYWTMTPDQKKSVKKIAWKIGRGLIALVALAVFDHFFLRAK